MLRHTKTIKEIYEKIQRQIYYLIPEKWESVYLYASVVDEEDKETGELFFYYIPKGILRKKPVNVYEVPSKFNIDDKGYLKLVEELYNEIKKLRKEFKKLELGETWSNVTMMIHNLHFRAEYHYEDLKQSPLSSFERHVIWRCQFLGLTLEQLNKEEKEILRKYASGPKTLTRIEKYDAGIYIKDIQNTVSFGTESEQYNKLPETTYAETEQKPEKKSKINQILSFKEDDKN